MTTFILVHGAGHGAWCWRDVVPALTKAGHQVLVPDLPGHGSDRTPLEEICLRSYVERVEQLVDQAEEPVILVGHSLGGVTISQVAEERSHALQQLIYLTAVTLQDGQCAADALSILTASPALLEMTEGTALISPDTELFYHDCPPSAITLAQRAVCPEPVQPLHEPVALSERFEAVPRAYIVCTDDHLIPLAVQRQYADAVQCDPVFSLPSSHSPFFSLPEQLAKVFLAFTSLHVPSRPLHARMTG